MPNPAIGRLPNIPRQPSVQPELVPVPANPRDLEDLLGPSEAWRSPADPLPWLGDRFMWQRTGDVRHMPHGSETRFVRVEGRPFIIGRPRFITRFVGELPAAPRDHHWQLNGVQQYSWPMRYGVVLVREPSCAVLPPPQDPLPEVPVGPGPGLEPGLTPVPARVRALLRERLDAVLSNEGLWNSQNHDRLPVRCDKVLRHAPNEGAMDAITYSVYIPAGTGRHPVQFYVGLTGGVAGFHHFVGPFDVRASSAPPPVPPMDPFPAPGIEEPTVTIIRNREPGPGGVASANYAVFPKDEWVVPPVAMSVGGRWFPVMDEAADYVCRDLELSERIGGRAQVEVFLADGTRHSLNAEVITAV